MKKSRNASAIIMKWLAFYFRYLFHCSNSFITVTIYSTHQVVWLFARDGRSWMREGENRTKWLAIGEVYIQQWIAIGRWWWVFILNYFYKKVAINGLCKTSALNRITNKTLFSQTPLSPSLTVPSKAKQLDDSTHSSLHCKQYHTESINLNYVQQTYVGSFTAGVKNRSVYILNTQSHHGVVIQPFLHLWLYLQGFQ